MILKNPYNSYLYLKVENYSESKLIKKLAQINVSIHDLSKVNNDIYFKITLEDYEKIDKYLKTIKFKKVRYTGIKYIIESIKRYKIIGYSIASILCIIIFLSSFIVDIEIKHENSYLTDIIYTELNNFGIKKFSFKKSFSNIQIIKEKIKEKYPDLIDWLEINEVGMKYVVRVEERKINMPDTPKTYCSVYAKKDSLIKKINVYNGESAINLNDYVKKGDLLINGDIKLNENIVNQVCAEGKIIGEVWYKVNITLPFIYYTEQKTGKKRINFIINYDDSEHVLFKDRLNNYKASKKLVIDTLGIKFYLRTDEEIIKKQHKYSEEEAIAKAISLATEKVKKKIGADEAILLQKVLQKRVNDSTIDLDIFIVTEEDIGNQVILKEETNNGV